MSEDYQHACERAELLGLPKPSEEEWRQSQAAQGENRRCDVDDDDDAALQDLDYVDDAAGRIGGGLDELNSILSTTQKKLNRFKTVCGSLGTLLKVKVNSRGGTPHHKPEEPNPDAGKQENQEKPESTVDEVMTVETSDVAITDTTNQPANSGVQQKQIDLNQKMGSHLNKLDSLITKAENAQYSMQHQTKQMKKILKK
ncbi:PREDICTED: uncharacterized protein LOC108765457 [Trachymyrmex cornetzi]|uniref:Synaptosomal-associated protein 29 n=1 Tax=Trachymyrmex cornetzi TaxID=471704 RepID=A0A151J0F2_9HYME|nr:PREDICTED: uncharacterized protein LOC108765457 [Trachymyrmex cornetzi]KYN14932.1 hypothetical protein ALC57_12828 [Trachymyrmex cornetzi]